jgi:hypothetical protein
VCLGAADAVEDQRIAKADLDGTFAQMEDGNARS